MLFRSGRRDATDEEVLAAARAANCDEFVSRMPQGYDTMILQPRPPAY